MTTYKQKLRDATQTLQLSQAATQKQNDLLIASLAGRMRFVARVPGVWHDEYGMVYQDKRTGTVVYLDHSEFLMTFDNLPAMLTFWRSLSDLPHNLKAIEILQEAAS